MKKKECRLVFFILMLFIFQGNGNAEKFGIKLTGGLNYLLVGEINDGIKGYFDLQKDSMALMPLVPGIPRSSVEGHPNPVHLGLDFEGCIMLNLTPRLEIGLGTGYIRAARASQIILRAPSGYEFKATHKTEISAIPIQLGVFYTLFENKRMKVFLNAGAGLYFANYSYEKEPIRTGETFMQQTADAKSPGVHGGLGWELKFTPNISLVLESHARYSRIKNLKGTRKHSGILYDLEETGTLYYWEGAAAFPNWKNPLIIKNYPIVYIMEKKPSGSYFYNVRKATIDFSGFTLMAGIRFNF